MAKGLEETLLGLLGDADAAAAQADLTQAVALARQRLSFQQRAGAAAARLRRARENGADAQEIAALEAELERRSRRLEAAGVQARAADMKRPQPDNALAQVFGRAEGKVEEPPLTAAALSQGGEVLITAVANANGTFHMTHEGSLEEVTIQLSDASGRVLYCAADPVNVAAGSVLYVDASLGEPRPTPGPVPRRPKMPELIGQNEGVALAILHRLCGPEVKVVDKVGEGQPDIVVDQSPEAGTELGEDVQVVLTVRRASGDVPETRYLPGLVGRPLEAALGALKELGLDHKVKPKVHHGPAGIVLAQAPAEGTPVDQVEKVELTVSQHRSEAPETVTVPNVTGKAKDLALELVKAADLEAEIKDIADPGAPGGVIEQDPAAGTSVRRGSTVIIVVNTPPDEPRTEVIVPSLVGRYEAAAVRVLARLSLEVEVAHRGDLAPRGEVIGQIPPPADRVQPGSKVVLIVSKGPTRGGDAGGELRPIVRLMAEDPRAEELGLDAGRITAMLTTGGIDDLDGARALAELAPDKVRDRVRMRSLRAAGSFRALLRRALKKMD